MTSRRAGTTLVVIALVAMTACGGGGDKDDSASATTAPKATTTTTTGEALGDHPDEAKAQIKAMWLYYFDEATPVPKKAERLENGDNHLPDIQQTIDAGLTKGTKVVVKDVSITLPTEATVTYDILLNGKVVVPDAKGPAKYIDDKWKVGEAVHCAIIALGNIHPPACAKALGEG